MCVRRHPLCTKEDRKEHLHAVKRASMRTHVVDCRRRHTDACIHIGAQSRIASASLDCRYKFGMSPLIYAIVDVYISDERRETTKRGRRERTIRQRRKMAQAIWGVGALFLPKPTRLRRSQLIKYPFPIPSLVIRFPLTSGGIWVFAFEASSIF